jgi:alpha-tubulin suppressor-like RCC1 family protein
MNGGSNNDMTPLSGIIAVAAGHYHEHILQANGILYSWGDYSMGTLGDGRSSPGKNNCEYKPVKVQNDQDPNSYRFVAIESGHRFEAQFKKTASFALAVKDDGRVMSWGKNISCECARRSGDQNVCYPSPGFVIDSTGSHLKEIVAVGACVTWGVALDVHGRLWRWGGYPSTNNEYADVSDESREYLKYDPVNGASGVSCARLVPGEENRNFKEIAAGSEHVLALSDDGTVFKLVFGLVQVDKSYLSSVKSIAAGGRHNLSLMVNGKVKSWGRNSDVNNDVVTYQLARATGRNDEYPGFAWMLDGTTKREIYDVAQVAAGMLNSFSIRADGTVVVRIPTVVMVT